MKRKIIYIALFLFCFNFDVYSQNINVYSASSGVEKDLDYLLSNGFLGKLPKPISEMTLKEKQKFVSENMDSRMKQIWLDHKKKEQVKGIPLGRVFVFLNVGDLKEEYGALLKEIQNIKNVKTKILFKKPKNMLSLNYVYSYGDDFMGISFGVDENNRLARKLHVTRYPEIIYIAPDNSKARYNLSDLGVESLKELLKKVNDVLSK